MLVVTTAKNAFFTPGIIERGIFLSCISTHLVTKRLELYFKPTCTLPNRCHVFICFVFDIR